MRSISEFIIEPKNNKRYNNTMNIGGVEFIMNSSEEDHKFSNRTAIVQQVPFRYEGDIKEGAEVIVHHNVFKFYNDMKGRRRSAGNFIEGDEFKADLTQIFAYKNVNDEDYTAIDGYCFVIPILADKTIHYGCKYTPLKGIMKYPDTHLYDCGVSEGDEITFMPNSEYEFDINGEKMYRVFSHMIVAKA